MPLSRMQNSGLFFDVKSLYPDTMQGLTKVMPNLTRHSFTLSFTVIMACQCHLKIALCHRFDATGNSRVDHLPRPAGFHAAAADKAKVWEKVLRDVFTAENSVSPLHE